MTRLSYQASLDFLLNLERSGIKLGLERTLALLSAVGDPHRRFRSIHVAGTNGKGSVVAVLEALLDEAGYSTGAFTSPHFLRFNERIRVASAEVPDTEIVDAFVAIDEARGDIALT